MLKKVNKNSGMSLIEVIVSMLVLSIAVVAVTMSFTAASRINLGSKQKQAVESLMENLMEYTEAGGTNYASWFAAASSVPEDTLYATQQQTLYKGIKQGLLTYDVRVLIDTAPTEYEKDKLNNYDVIQFGGASSNTIMIDASLKSYDVSTEFGADVSDYDEMAYKFFSNMHTSAVLEHNLADEQAEEADPDGHEEDPWDLTEKAQIPNFVDRELRLIVTKPTEDKMQLTANLTYILNASIQLPTGTSHTYERTLFVSDMYDLASNTEEGAKKLNQIYIMYSPAKLEPLGYGLGQDIRVMDPGQDMKANIFIANQQTASKNLNDAILLNSIDALDTTTYKVMVSFENPNDSSENYNPAGGDIYCSGDMELHEAATFAPATMVYKNKLVAKGKEVRIITTKLDILESGTDTVLATKTVTHLQ